MGIAYSIYTQALPPKPTWGVNDIPDLTGRVMVVTGGYAGIGKETVKALLAKNAKVYIAARSHDKAQRAIDELKAETDKEAIFLKLDLADLKAVKAAAEEFLSKEKELHVLFNNGGVMIPPIEQLTADGYDLQFGTNVIGHWYFTKLLLPTLIATAKKSTDGHARVVNTSSSASELTSMLDFNSFKDGPARKKKGTEILYAQSKLGNVVVSNELARRYGSQGIVSTSMNPGNLRTELQRHTNRILLFFTEWMLYPAPFGALTQLWAGTSSEGLQANGKYLIPWARMGAGNKVAWDQKLGEELWTWLEEQVKDI